MLNEWAYPDDRVLRAFWDGAASAQPARPLQGVKLAGDLHPVEAAWPSFRASRGGGLLKRSLELRQLYLDYLGLKRCPPEVILPVAVPWNLPELDGARRRDEEAGRSPGGEVSFWANSAHVWAAYRESKTIYEFEPALGACLERSDWPERAPTAALRLPSRCPVLAVPGKEHSAYLAATYNLITGAEETRALELRLSMLVGAAWLPISFLHLTRGTLRECVEATAAEARLRGVPERSGDMWRNGMLRFALTMLLYISGDPDVVKAVHPGARPAVKPKLQRTDPERFADLKEPTTYAVGKNFTRAIERWEKEHRDDPGVAAGRALRPHMRRAHSHLYWTGWGRGQPRVRFLLPISVKGGKLVEEPEHPLETKVR